MIEDPSIIQKRVRFASVTALSVNITLGTLKIIVGSLISSIALIADGFDSVMDLFMGIFAYFGTILSHKPPDKDHLYGHEKIEIIFLILILVLIYITGIGILIEGINRLYSEVTLEFSIIGLLIIIISVVGKLYISIFVYRTGKLVNSKSLKATGINYMTDVVSSSLALLAMASAFFGYGVVDSIAALLICVLIFYGATRMLMDTVDIILDRAPSEKIQKQIIAVSSSVQGVKEVHLLRARIIQNRIIGDVHILVNPNLTVQEGHKISEKVNFLLQSQLNASIIVHLEPFDKENQL